MRLELTPEHSPEAAPALAVGSPVNALVRDSFNANGEPHGLSIVGIVTAIDPQTDTIMVQEAGRPDVHACHMTNHLLVYPAVDAKRPVDITKELDGIRAQMGLSPLEQAQ